LTPVKPPVHRKGIHVVALQVMSRFTITQFGVSSLALVTLLAPLLLVALTPAVVSAQRPYFANDPLYRDERARRDYENGYALSGELSYRSVQSSSLAGVGSVGVLFRIDYQLASQFDVSAILDVYSQLNAQAMRVAWIAVRHQWYSDGADMAVRLAIEPRPAVGGGLGFRQTDLGFFYSKVLSATIETDMALGVRHVRTASQSIDTGALSFNLDETDGFEAHVQLGYNMVFDPARSHVSVSLAYEAGRYTVTSPVRPPEVADQVADEFAGHVLWLQTGLHWYRPSYQLVPFINVPILAGKRGEGFTQGQGPRFVNLGIRLTLR
jgi:hypothetical protein